jgi:predicted nucleic acid-binding protein
LALAAAIIADTGPLVAALISTDRHHDWARAELARLRPPLVTCEPVLTEAAHIIAANGGDPAVIVRMPQTGSLKIDFRVDEDPASLATLMHRYRNVPMSLADACLVRLSERFERGFVWTTDSDFRIYRRNGRHVIPVLMPDDMGY